MQYNLTSHETTELQNSEFSTPILYVQSNLFNKFADMYVTFIECYSYLLEEMSSKRKCDLTAQL